MRKIEQWMVATIKDQRDAVALHEQERITQSKNNTKIVTGRREDGKVITSVYLYGNMIAQGDAFSWGFKMCGFPTQTTKSRINAIVLVFGRDGVYTKASKHYSGNQEVNEYDWF